MSISSRRISASNPMSTVDIATIQHAMKMANLDTLRGYTQNHYGEVRQFSNTEYISQNQALGYQVLREPLWNKCERNPISFFLPSPFPTISQIHGMLLVLSFCITMAWGTYKSCLPSLTLNSFPGEISLPPNFPLT